MDAFSLLSFLPSFLMNSGAGVIPKERMDYELLGTPLIQKVVSGNESSRSWLSYILFQNAIFIIWFQNSTEDI